MLNRIILLVFALTLARSAEAALVWKQQRVELMAAPLDEEVEAVWQFSNAGATAVTLGPIHSTCGCTVPHLAQSIYAPGESGEVRAIFTFGEREGRQEKQISVTTDEPGRPTYELEFVVDIPRLFQMSQRFVFWRLNGEAAPKTIELRALYPDIVLPESVEVRDQRFLARLERDSERPDQFRIIVTPETTTSLAQAPIVVRTVTFPSSGAAPRDPPILTFYGLVR